MVLMAEYREESLIFSEYIQMFLTEAELNSKKTFSTYKNSLEMMSRNLFKKELMYLTKEEVESITYKVLFNYRKVLSDSGNTNGTVNTRISAIKEFIRYLSDKEVITYTEAKLLSLKGLKDDSSTTEMIPEDVLYNFVDYFAEYKRKGQELKWATILLLETGNRSDEIVNIKKNQFIQDGDTYILKSKGENRGKGNKDYAERISAELYDELMKLNPDSDEVFTISYKVLNKAFADANDYFGHKYIRYTPHSIKHLAVTLEYRYTGCILAAQRKGKHSSVATTERYLRISNILNVGAYSRKISTKTDMYKQVDLDALISTIDKLPSDIKQLLNYRLEQEYSEK